MICVGRFPIITRRSPGQFLNTPNKGFPGGLDSVEVGSYGPGLLRQSGPGGGRDATIPIGPVNLDVGNESDR